MKPAYRRRHFLVDTFQYRLLAISIGHIVVFSLLVAASLFLPSIMVLLDASQSIAQKGQAADVFLRMDARFWPSALLMFVLIGAHSVLVSHRIAGPLVGFRRVLKAVGEGDLSVRARIRRHDYLAKEAESINGMIAGLGDQVTEIQEQFRKIRAAWGALRTSLHTASTEEAARGVETLGVQIDALGARLDRFKVGL
jgi:methyl-accepting chemotaxis protein